jgi:hypothetical protein
MSVKEKKTKRENLCSGSEPKLTVEKIYVPKGLPIVITKKPDKPNPLPEEKQNLELESE